MPCALSASRVPGPTAAMRGDGCEAARTDECDAGPLELDAAARFGVIEMRDELLFARAHLQGERALRRLGQHQLGIEAHTDLVREAEPVEPAGGEDDRVQPALAHLA